MKFDLHMHTRISFDCMSDVEAILRKAQKNGLDGIAITEHDKFHDYDIAGLEKKYQVWIIPGVEVSTTIGDIIGLYVSNNIEEKDADKAIDEIHRQGGLAILAHPFKRTKGMKEYPVEVVRKLDAVEQVNSRWVDLEDYRDVAKVAAILSLVPGRTAGSDSHFVFEIGNAYLETPFLTDKDQLRAIISEGTGVPGYVKITSWLDLLSQSVKFRKKPRLRQAVRLVYYFFRQLFQNNNRRRIS